LPMNEQAATVWTVLAAGVSVTVSHVPMLEPPASLTTSRHVLVSIVLGDVAIVPTEPPTKRRPKVKSPPTSPVLQTIATPRTAVGAGVDVTVLTAKLDFGTKALGD